MEIPVHIREGFEKDIEEKKEEKELEKVSIKKDKPKNTSLNGMWILIVLMLVGIISILLQKNTKIQDSFNGIRNGENQITTAISIGCLKIHNNREKLLEEKINFLSETEQKYCFLEDSGTGSDSTGSTSTGIIK